jgi:hypothetical protein
MTNEISDIPTTPTADAIEAPVVKQKLNVGSLRMIGHFTIKYPRQIAYALLALIGAASSTLAIPYGLRLIIDEGFAKNGGDPAPYFYLLLGIVVIIGVSTAFRFYFVSWLGERVVRIMSPASAPSFPKPLAQSKSFRHLVKKRVRASDLQMRSRAHLQPRKSV